MPDYLRINRERRCSQAEQDEEIRSPECYSVAQRNGLSSVGCGQANTLSLLRGPFGHQAGESFRAATFANLTVPVRAGVCRLRLAIPGYGARLPHLRECSRRAFPFLAKRNPHSLWPQICNDFFAIVCC